MKLIINGFENSIDFDDEHINILEINDAKCFSHIIQTIYDKINKIESNEIILIDEDEKQINMSNNAYIILDLFNIDYNSKKILDKIYEIIEKNINENQDYKIAEITNQLKEFLINEINELPFEFVMQDSLNIQKILKLFELKLDSSCYSTVLEKLEFLVDLLSYLNLSQILIIPNLKDFLNEEETIEFYKYTMYNNIKLLIIERENERKLTYEKILKIDESYNDFIY